MVLVILILALVASISGANIYYDNTSITIEVSTSLTVSTINSAFDQCYKLIRRPSALYHLSSESVIQNWTPGTTNNNTVSFPQGPSSHVIDFSVNAAGTFGLTLDSISKSYSTYLLTPNLLFYGTTAISSPTSPTQIKKTASAIYYFYKLYNSTHDAIIKATATNTTYQLTTINA
jgi:type II secretory pathway pseudopilin PulG